MTDNNHKQLLRFAADHIPPVPDIFGAAQGVTGDVTSDAEDAGGNVWFTEFNSNRVGVVSFKPVNTQGPVILGVPKVGQRVTCGSGGWTNNPAAFTYQWLLDGTPISGETNQSHDVQANESGHQLTCQVTASNGSGTGAPATSASVIVSSAPLLQNTVLPVVLKGGHAASTVVSGDVVTCQPGTWNSSSITRRNYFWAWATSFLVRVGKLSHYQHERTVLNSGSAQTIKLPDLPGYVPGNLRETSVISCIEDVGDGTQDASAESQTVPVLPLRPVLATRFEGTKHGLVQVPIDPPSITSGVGAGGTNTCAHGLWTHFPVVYSYSWWSVNKRGKRIKSLHPGASFAPSFDDEGLRIACFVVAKNGAGSSRPAESNSHVVPAGAARSLTPPVVTLSTKDPDMGPVQVGPNTHLVPPGANGNPGWRAHTAIAHKIYLTCDPGTWSRDVDTTTSWIVDGYGSHPGALPIVPVHYEFGGDSLRFNFEPTTTQDPYQFDGTVVCTVVAKTKPKHGNPVESTASSQVLTIWNGCDVVQYGDSDGELHLLPGGVPQICQDYVKALTF